MTKILGLIKMLGLDKFTTKVWQYILSSNLSRGGIGTIKLQLGVLRSK